VASRARAFGMRVIAMDPVLSTDVAADLGISLVSFDELVDQSDFISIHAPMNNATRDLFDDDSLLKCRKGVRIINCARGGIVNEGALLRALDTGHVGGAALDVYSVEPPSDDLRALLEHPRVVATPHIAASTDEAQEKVARQVTQQIIFALRNEPVSTAVNLSIAPADGSAEYQPYYELASKLGLFAARMLDGHARRVEVGCRGEMLRAQAPNLEVAVLQGFLSTISSAPVNHVSAPFLAKEAGLQSGYETHDVNSAFSSQIDVVIETDADKIEVSGTVFGDGKALIVRVNGYRLEVRPEGTILLYKNDDRPGMLARVGAILAKSNINIAALALGRKTAGEAALTIISVDEPVTTELISELSAVDGIYEIRAIEL
jgi:D-3-phosphoglycerate dehydrogenase / 2-oxoglutarate reductase